MRTWTIEKSIDCGLVVIGEYFPGDRYAVTSATIQPPDPERIEIKQILLAANGNSVDILHVLSEKDVESIKTEILGGIHEDG